MWPTMVTSKTPRRRSKSQTRRLLPPTKEISVPPAAPPAAPPPDPNMSDPRLLINRPCIYERRLPSDAHIAAYVQRLQHGFYSNAIVSDFDSDYVDFLGISFVFHSAQSNYHRFKSALIRVSLSDETDSLENTDLALPDISDLIPSRPRFLMHAPHLLYGTVSPETMQWNFSLAGALGVSEGPVNASIIPSGGLNGRYNRYEMMRIQGSARTPKSPRGREFDTESAEIVWSLEENSLDRTGLPREFTFVMLVQKPAPDSKVKLDINIEPDLQSRLGSYPSWVLSLPNYQAVQRNRVDFSKEIGQRFAPIIPGRGFNFASLKSAFEDYMAMPGRHHSRQIEIPPDNSNQYSGYPQYQGGQGYQGNWGLNPANLLSSTGTQFSATNVQEQILRAQLNSLPMSLQGGGGFSQQPYRSTQQQLRPPPPPPPPRQPTGNIMNLNIAIENPIPAISNHFQWRSPPVTTESEDDDDDDEAPPEDNDSSEEAEGWLAALRLADGDRARAVAGKCHEEDTMRRGPSRAPLEDASRRVMSMANVPATNSMLSSLAANRRGRERSNRRHLRDQEHAH